MSGSLVVVGLGPGSIELLTPAASRVLHAATDLVGYGPYLERIPEMISGQRRHASDNRVEIDRARHALTLAAEGRKVAVVSGGDPGVFAMAAAVFEAIENGDFPSLKSTNGGKLYRWVMVLALAAAVLLALLAVECVRSAGQVII